MLNRLCLGGRRSSLSHTAYFAMTPSPHPKRAKEPADASITVSPLAFVYLNISKDHIISQMNNHRFSRLSFLYRRRPQETRTAPYSYGPLSKSAHEIRLLTILPGNLGEDIRVQLSTRTLTQKRTPSYEALSYAWGTAEDPTNIYVMDTISVCPSQPL